MFTECGTWKFLTVQLGHISSFLVCRRVSIATATSLADRKWGEEGRIDLMTTSTSVTLLRGSRTSCFCFTTTILKRQILNHPEASCYNQQPHPSVLRYLSSSWLLNSLKTPLHSVRVWNVNVLLEESLCKLLKIQITEHLPFLNTLHLCHRLQSLPHPAPTRTEVHAVKKQNDVMFIQHHWHLKIV